MNPLNYASLEACKKLAEAGIVIETEYLFDLKHPDREVHKHPATNLNDHPDFIPRPSMAEVWRELPERIENLDGYDFLRLDKEEEETTCGYGQYAETGRSTNPTDALIDIKIWLEKEKKDGHE